MVGLTYLPTIPMIPNDSNDSKMVGCNEVPTYARYAGLNVYLGVIPILS